MGGLYEPVYGVYADAATGFESKGTWDIARMVGIHNFGIDHTGSEATSVEYADSWAIGQWMWEGTVITGVDDGKTFSMRAQTTFEIENSLIARSIDDYVLTDAPWG